MGNVFSNAFRWWQEYPEVRPGKRTREEFERDEVANSPVGRPRKSSSIISFQNHIRSGLQYGATYLYYEKDLTQEENPGHAKFTVHVKKSAEETFTACELVGTIRAGHLAKKPTLLVCQEDINIEHMRMQSDKAIVARWVATPL